MTSPGPIGENPHLGFSWLFQKIAVNQPSQDLSKAYKFPHSSFGCKERSHEHWVRRLLAVYLACLRVTNSSLRAPKFSQALQNLQICRANHLDFCESTMAAAKFMQIMNLNDKYTHYSCRWIFHELYKLSHTHMLKWEFLRSIFIWKMGSIMSVVQDHLCIPNEKICKVAREKLVTPKSVWRM